MNVAAGFTTGFSFYYSSGASIPEWSPCMTGRTQPVTFWPRCLWLATGSNCDASVYSIAAGPPLAFVLRVLAKSVDFGCDSNVSVRQYHDWQSNARWRPRHELHRAPADPSPPEHSTRQHCTLFGGDAPYNWTFSGLPSWSRPAAMQEAASRFPGPCPIRLRPRIPLRRRRDVPMEDLTASQSIAITVCAGPAVD